MTVTEIETKDVTDVLEFSIFFMVKNVSRHQTRLVIGASAVILFLLYQLVCIAQRRRQTKIIDKVDHEDKLHLLHKSSHGITSAFDEREISLLQTWSRTHCRCHKERMDLLGNLFWYRLLSAPSISLPEQFLTMSWLDVLVWASNTSSSSKCSLRFPFPCDQQVLLKRIVISIGMCHVQNLVWPECAIDTLILHALSSSESSCNPISSEMLTRIRGHLILLGILTTTSEQEDGIDCYKLIDITSWDDGAHCNQHDFFDLSWVSRFVDALKATILFHRGDFSHITKIQPSSMKERSLLVDTLTGLLLNLGMDESLQCIRKDPFSTHCRLLGGSFQSSHSTDTIPTMISEETEATKRQQETVLLETQVLWKQRCCDRIIGREGRIVLAELFKQVALTLIRFSTHDDLARSCIRETKNLRTEHLAWALENLINALHYMGQVLWSAGRTQTRGDTALSLERQLSRRMFALEKSLQFTALQPHDFVDWISSVKSIYLETASMEQIDIRQGHIRLSNAMENFDTVYNNLVEISALSLDGVE